MKRIGSRRIRSLRIGPSATVTAYAETAFKGHSQQFGPADRASATRDALSARIQSLEVACVESRAAPVNSRDLRRVVALFCAAVGRPKYRPAHDSRAAQAGCAIAKTFTSPERLTSDDRGQAVAEA